MRCPNLSGIPDIFRKAIEAIKVSLYDCGDDIKYHGSRHKTGGADPLTPADISAASSAELTDHRASGDHDTRYLKLSGGGSVSFDSGSERIIRTLGTGVNWGLYFNSSALGMYDWQNNRGILAYSSSANTLTITSPLTVNGALYAAGNLYWGLSNLRVESAADFGAAKPSGFYQYYQATNAPYLEWFHLLNVRHSNPANNYQMQFAGQFYNSNDLYYRVTNDNPSAPWCKMWHSGNLPLSYVCLEEQQTSATHGGTFQTGARRTRVINTEVSDTAGICTLATNQFSLVAGTYDCKITCTAFNVGDHLSWLYNATDGIDQLRSQPAYCSTADNGFSVSSIYGRFTISGTKTFSVQHQCSATANTTGFGRASGLDTNVYLRAEFWKVA